MLLRPEHRRKLDENDDRLFYSFPRLVNHVDEGFIQQLTDVYRQRLKPHTAILDMMSSWVSHLPDEMEFTHLEGLGMNEEELAKNPRLNHYVIHDLNQSPQIPFPEQSFDGVLNCVSIQYLQYPEAIFHEVHRILKPGGVAIFSFSNRMFFEKAIAIWRESSEQERIELVKGYFQGVRSKDLPGFSIPEVVVRVSHLPHWMRILGMGGDPFYAVIAYRQ